MSHKVTYDPINKIWKGPEVEPRPFGNKSMGQVVHEAMLQDLQHVCQISDDSGEIYTNERMLRAAISFANALKAKGIVKGDKVIFLMHNHHYLLAAWLGCILNGVVLSTFYFLDSSVQGELCELVNQIKPKMMITSYFDAVDTFKSIFKEINHNCPIYIYENKIEGCHDLKPLLEQNVTSLEDFQPEGVTDPDKELLVIILSSSTTGKPKLINGTHSQMLHQVTMPLSKFVIGTTMQPGWHSELIVSLFVLVKYNVRIIRPFYTIDDFLHMVEKHQIQAVYIKPKDIFQIIKSETIKTVNLESLIMVGSIGEHMSVKMAEDLQQYIPNGAVLSMYGISDIGGALTDPSNLEGFVHQLVGVVKKGFEIIVIDEDGNRLGPKETGELAAKQTSVPFAGYYENEKLTRESVTSDGFFYTGDIGYLDEGGNVFLVDRKKFHIAYCGKVLNQSNVERIVLENVKGVSGVCVVDVEHEKYGMIPYIAIIPERRAILKESEVIKTIMKHHEYEFDTKVFFFNELPMTISAKYKKHLVREMIMKQIAKQT